VAVAVAAVAVKPALSVQVFDEIAKEARIFFGQGAFLLCGFFESAVKGLAQEDGFLADQRLVQIECRGLRRTDLDGDDWRCQGSGVVLEEAGFSSLCLSCALTQRISCILKPQGTTLIYLVEGLPA